jgi:hypothetical protein
MCVLGWGSMALLFALLFQVINSYIVFNLDFQINLIRYSIQLLKFLVPGSLLACLVLIFLIVSAARKEYGGTLSYLKQLHWKSKSSIWRGINFLFYMAGCVVFLQLLLRPRWLFPFAD